MASASLLEPRGVRSTHRPLKVYSRKRYRASADPPRTSPLKDVDSTVEDMSIQEMSRRMMKRYRSSMRRNDNEMVDDTHDMSGLETQSCGAEEERPKKKAKRKDDPQNMLFTSASMNQSAAAFERSLSLDASTPASSPRKMQSHSMSMNQETQASEAFIQPAQRTVLHNLKSRPPTKFALVSRPSSRSLKENDNPSALLPLLASPFQSRTPSGPSSPTHKKHKKPVPRLKPLASRTRSAATALRRSDTDSRDHSASAFRRRPSDSHTLQHKRKQSWLVPAQVSSLPPTEPSQRDEFRLAEICSLFDASPQASSTPPASHSVLMDVPPTPGRFHDITVTPRPVTSTLLFSAVPSDIMMTDNTPRSCLPSGVEQDSLFSSAALPHIRPSPQQALPNRSQKCRQRTHIHLPEDSIFASPLDFSTSVTVKQPLSKMPALHAKFNIPQNSDSSQPMSLVSDYLVSLPPSQSAGNMSVSDDELGNMFSILGLDEAEKVLHSALDLCLSAASGKDGSSPKPGNGKQAKKTSSHKHSSSKKFLLGKKQGLSHHTSQRQRTSRYTASISSPARRSRSSPLPTIKMKIEDRALLPSSTEEDELLLTYRGWEWDPSSDV